MIVLSTFEFPWQDSAEMAHADQKMKSEKFTPKDGNWKKSRNNVQGFKHKRKWVPEQKAYEGSIKEGQGFALKRKEKVRHQYNKLLRKERQKHLESKALYKEEYPEHLKHLYMAEAQKLKSEAWTNRLNRRKLRITERDMKEEGGESAGDDDDDAAASTKPDLEATDGPELTDAGTGNPESSAAVEKEGLPMSNRMRKKVLKKTSYQKTKEEFEAIAKKRREKKEEYLKNSKQREEAIQKYKKKKMETFQILKKKTRKGQPNLNLQMEHLLQKITQRTGK